jgi:hypothetical protein
MLMLLVEKEMFRGEESGAVYGLLGQGEYF